MTLIGMLHHREDPRKVAKAYTYSVVAKAEGVEFFYFTPGKVDIENQKIKGKYYENGVWLDKEYPFPDAIYNASYPLSENAERIVDYLSERIPFTSHSIGDKLGVHNRIMKGKDFKQYLIPTVKLTNSKEILELINLYPKVIMKPVSGHQGVGILFIEKLDDGHFKINELGKTLIYKKQELLNKVLHKIQEQDYIAQKFISSQMKSGNVYDFRLHVQKNRKGKWVITTIYPRIGPLGSITSNLSGGGYTAYLDEFLQKEFHIDWFNMKRLLEHFSLSFPNHFESLYDGIAFDELGIDVGIDENQKLWLFEVNWRPGAPVIFNRELDVAINTIHYATYLATHNKDFHSKKSLRENK
ncbi:YheC/YheD family protein [Paenisporosarcina sp. TG20]|uniref:YheC/YheD family endospore coat-associated protein n=1 Tax=Paenisporosarcina sp. TG20 TaxID=1211706 RepID=UPI0002E8F650|nr:YheC/YheD family protein [Paenisporosarcina sp. TG20]